MKKPIFNDFDRFILAHEEFKKSKFAKRLRKEIKIKKTLKKLKKWKV